MVDISKDTKIWGHGKETGLSKLKKSQLEFSKQRFLLHIFKNKKKEILIGNLLMVMNLLVAKNWKSHMVPSEKE